ncbi:carbonic anhydrase [Ranunculus cassubicifolius]
MHLRFLSLLLAILLIHSTAQEVEDQREFDYIKGSGRGPEVWGNLHEEWASCNNGDLQSPVDLSSERVKIVPSSSNVKVNYKPSNATLKNRGHDIEIKWVGDAGSAQVDGKNYTLIQSHWHAPSEHSINGRRFALELHMVHQYTDPVMGNRIAVIGILYNKGRPQKFLSELENDIRHITDSDREINIGIVNPTHIKIAGKKYYRYTGSLTTPPCTQGVRWIINRKIRSVSVEQMSLLREAVHDSMENNARPLQPLNNREISLQKMKNGWKSQN